MYEADKTQRMVQPDIYPVGAIDPVRIRKIEELFVSEGVARTIVAPEDFIFGLRKQERIDLTPAEQDFIQKHPTLRVIKSFHQPPFTIHEGHSVTGYLHDLLLETLNIAGLKARYVYAEDEEGLAPGNSSEKTSNATMAALLNDLPEKVIARLKEATELSDAAMIDDVIEEIRAKHTRLAEALSEMAGNFNYDGILALTEGSKSI